VLPAGKSPDCTAVHVSSSLCSALPFAQHMQLCLTCVGSTQTSRPGSPWVTHMMHMCIKLKPASIRNTTAAGHSAEPACYTFSKPGTGPKA
jgi:hypothetical protein